MEKVLNKFYDWIDKIGKHNFMLIIFIFAVSLVTGLYTTFSIFTSTDLPEMISGVPTYKFILNGDINTNSVVIAANSSKGLEITVSNNETSTLNYGIYYSSSNDLTNVVVGKTIESSNSAKGTIDSTTDLTVLVRVENNSDTDVTIDFGLSFGLESGGELTLESEQYWVDDELNWTIDNGKVYLNEVEAGSYVRYIGNNGCTGDSCSGVNANSSDTSNGWCQSSSKVINSTGIGWRVAYINNNSAYLISGGTPECLATDSSGTPSSANVSLSTIESTAGLPSHITNLNNVALKYCNAGFSSGGSCNSNSTWFMSEEDYHIMTGGSLSVAGCFDAATTTCGNNSNDLIDIDTYYWINHLYDNSSNSDYYQKTLFNHNATTISHNFSNHSNGVRPVIKLDSSVEVIGGTGIKSDPYLINNPNTVKDLSGNMNNGALVNGTSWNQYQGTVTTDGVDDYINLGLKNYDFGNTLSFIVRFKHSAQNSDNNTYHEFFGNWEGGGGGIGITTEEDAELLTFNLYIGGQYVKAKTSFTEFSTDEWYTVVGTYDGSNIKLYLNGELKATTATSGNVGISSAEISLGYNPGENIGAHNKLSSSYVLIYDRAITAEEVTANFSGDTLDRNQVDTTDLILYYDFHE